MARMGRSHKLPTAQELYRARKQKEEQERDAFLPPGLVNNGNTCFMNSVLQGLIATPMLADIVRFSLPDTHSAVSARRSPQLTNGHGRGGEWERAWEQGMPLGDVFVVLMDKAWKLQDERARTSMCPKELLAGLGAKYDQYLDFRQQDAHELLRHLLDAMRMEELDIIKKRQPPQPKAKRKKKGKESDLVFSLTSLPPSGPSSIPIPEEDHLTSFVDMVFGGRLASILVCEKCKKVSCTYEDFNDLSLSIRPEDYEKVRRHDRLRSLARKLGMRGRSTKRELEFADVPRSSSVPASPTGRNADVEPSVDLAIDDLDQRRRSLDSGEMTVLANEDPEETQHESTEVPVEGSDNGERRALGVLEENKGWKENDKQDDKKRGGRHHHREKDDDGWVKLRRRISIGIGVTKSRKESESKDSFRDPSSNDEGRSDAPKDDTIDAFVDIKSPSPAGSPALGASKGLPMFSFSRRPSPSRTGSPALLAPLSPPGSPRITPAALPEKRPPSPSPATPLRPKSPRPSKPSREQSAYVRRLLADVPATAATPFGTLRGSLAEMSDARGLWLKLGRVQSVGECLRMFTAVEVLDGENMVGCRRCWKVQHGEYVPRGRSSEKDAECMEDEEDEDEDDEDISSSSSASVKINLVEEEEPPSKEVSTSVNSLKASLMVLDEGLSTQKSAFSRAPRSSLPVKPGPLSVPSISMTAPESSPSTAEATPIAETLAVEPAYVQSHTKVVSSPSRDSLKLPVSRHVRRPAERYTTFSLNSDTSSASSDESSDEAEETETSLTASVHSDNSSVASVSRDAWRSPPSVHSSPGACLSTPLVRPKAVSRVKKVVPRRAYKRYLVAEPPPVLVVHLKRFHQVGRSQFFTNFKKLDDPVSFPEYLDLSPFLLPSKEGPERGKGKGKEKRKGKENEDEELSKKVTNTVGDKCMYRLYAVVVHIGNMLGGHYVAYTALPEATPTSSSDEFSAGDAPFINSRTNALRPENPRTVSFARTANPYPSKSWTSSAASGTASTLRQWCYVSDTTVRLASLEEVLKAKAYICMYERI